MVLNLKIVRLERSVNLSAKLNSFIQTDIRGVFYLNIKRISLYS